MPTLPTGRIFFGGDYNPEQWPESVWLEDMQLMREAGVNLVSIGIFSWARLQSGPDIFHWEWLDRLMDLLVENGISADLATATASPPAWLIKLHPEILPVKADGTIYSQGSRQHYNPSSSAYRVAIAELVTALATRYKDHPAMVMWHINNEYACHVAADFGEETATAFREWLQARYSTLDALNHAWGTSFWSQYYYDWQEVLPPRAAPTFSNPGQSLDFQHFSSDALLQCCKLEAEILREVTPNIPITNNFMGIFKPLDYRKWARELDFASHDVYPEPESAHRWNGQTCDFTRSLKDNAPWLVMEQVTTHVNWRPRNATKPPGVMRLWSYQAVARGADGICFFQWRQSRAGAEKFHGAMVGHGNPATQRCFQETKKLGNELALLSELTGTQFKAEVGIFFDWQNWWALELPSKPNAELTYYRGLENFHTPLLARNIATDFVFADSDLSKYRVIFIPTLYMVVPAVAEKLIAWVEAGGELVVTYFSGLVDENDSVHLGGYPGPLRKLLGLEVEEWAIPTEKMSNSITTTAVGRTLGLAENYSTSFWSEVIRVEGAEVLATFDSDYFAGQPAITRHAYGKGHAWYIGTEPDAAYYEHLTQFLTNQANVRPAVVAPEGVEVCERHSSGGKGYVFLLNHTQEAVTINDATLAGCELLTKADIHGELTIAPRDVAIVRRS